MSVVRLGEELQLVMYPQHSFKEFQHFFREFMQPGNMARLATSTQALAGLTG